MQVPFCLSVVSFPSSLQLAPNDPCGLGRPHPRERFAADERSPQNALYIEHSAEYHSKGANPEDKMSFMKSLTLTAVPKVQNDPTRSRRERLASRLQEQKELVSNPSLVRAVQRTVKKEGLRTVVETHQKIRPWWRMDEKGQVVFFVRLGWKPIEFEKGKAGVIAGSMEKLPAVIDTLIAAVRAGELDQIVDQARATRPTPKKKAA